MKQITDKTVLKQGDKVFTAVEVDISFLFAGGSITDPIKGVTWIDKDADRKVGNWVIDLFDNKCYQSSYNLGTIDSCRGRQSPQFPEGEPSKGTINKIVAATFDLEGVPNIQNVDEIEEFTDKYFELPHARLQNQQQKEYKRELLRVGYNANPNKYTEKELADSLRDLGIECCSADGSLANNASPAAIFNWVSNRIKGLNSIKEIEVDSNFNVLNVN